MDQTASAPSRRTAARRKPATTGKAAARPQIVAVSAPVSAAVRGAAAASPSETTLGDVAATGEAPVDGAAPPRNAERSEVRADVNPKDGTPPNKDPQSASPDEAPRRKAKSAAVTPEDVHAVVAGYPNMSLEHGRKIYDMILSHGSRRVLELGFNWGVSSCYIAAALQTQGGDGHLVSIDLQSRASFDPGIEGFLDKLGLRRRVTVFYEATTFNWRLRRFLRMDPRPEFDLVFLDGPHLWEPDALAFLLAEKMLRPGGLFVFDDLNWTLSNSPFHREQEATLALPADERNTAHVREVFELLVKTHPNIEATWENSAWGHARKRKTPLSGGLDAWIAEEAKAVKRHASQHCGPKKGLNAPGKG